MRVNRIILLFLLLSCIVGSSCITQEKKEYSTWELAEKALRKGLQMDDLGTYQGCLLLQGMAEMAVANPESAFVKETEDTFLKFSTQGIVGKGSFISYQAGGNGAAYFDYMFRYLTNTLHPQVGLAAEAMMTEQPRSLEGIMVPPWIKEKTIQTMSMQSRSLDGTHILDGNIEGNNPVFIDMAYATTPFLLYAGLANNRQEYIDEAVFQTLSLFDILRDKETGLLHQGRGFQGVNVLSEDNWSRGNAWGAIAIASLVRDLPDGHPKKEQINSIAKEFFLTILKYQNKEGLWHQEMTDPSSFVETSGSGILLYALGIMLEKGLLDVSYTKNFTKGLQGLAAYLEEDGSVSNCCWSCLCIRQGTKEDYKNHAWIYNDSHAFGPIVLVYAQAYRMGIKRITPLKELGINAKSDTIITSPRTYVKYVPERMQDIAWENDRIAFRVFGYPVRDKVGSGIDIWAKRVEYPVLDRWYRFNKEGLDYHTDRGEGCDFYNAGHLRGCGGLAIFTGDTVSVSETYINHRIHKNTENEIIFELLYSPWEADGKFYSERKTIRMKKGTNFFEVTSLIDALAEEEIVVGIGLTNFGNAQVEELEKETALVLWEKIDPAHGELGVSAIVPKNIFKEFKKVGQDHYLTLNVKTGQPFTYRVGAGWETSGHFRSFSDWKEYVVKQSETKY